MPMSDAATRGVHLASIRNSDTLTYGGNADLSVNRGYPEMLNVATMGRGRRTSL